MFELDVGRGAARGGWILIAGGLLGLLLGLLLVLMRLLWLGHARRRRRNMELVVLRVLRVLRRIGSGPSRRLVLLWLVHWRMPEAQAHAPTCFKVVSMDARFEKREAGGTLGTAAAGCVGTQR
jgi:hypothetical protein